MIDWSAFLLVAAVSLLGACLVVAVAALGMRLYENGQIARQTAGMSGRSSLTAAFSLFAICAVIALFGIYLIVPTFH